MKITLKIPRPLDVVKKDLRSPKYRMRVVQDKRYKDSRYPRQGIYRSLDS